MAGTYRELREKILVNLHSRNADSFWYLSTENQRQMKTMYTQIGNMTSFLEWLNYMVAQEDQGVSSGVMFVSTGGA